jgi:hypothetical protein
MLFDCVTRVVGIMLFNLPYCKDLTARAGMVVVLRNVPCTFSTQRTKYTPAAQITYSRTRCDSELM